MFGRGAGGARAVKRAVAAAPRAAAAAAEPWPRRRLGPPSRVPAAKYLASDARSASASSSARARARQPPRARGRRRGGAPRRARARAQCGADLGALPAALARAPHFLGRTRALAHFLDRALHDRPAEAADAPAWFEAASALVRAQLAERTVGAPPDSLRAPAAVLAAALAVLGAAHLVACEAAALAEANTSPAERAQRAEPERARQAALAAALLAQEWPDEAHKKAARAADRDAKTPVPERCWALRNVAGALAMGGPGERTRARELLEQAVLLKQRFAGAPDHPGVLPELVALYGVLAAEPEWAADAGGVARLALRALAGVADAYAAAGDAAAAATLLEAALRRYEEAAGVGSKAVQRATREADALLAALPPEGREAVAAARRGGGGDALPDRVAAALTEELGAHQAGGGARSRVQEWDQRGAELIGELL